MNESNSIDTLNKYLDLSDQTKLDQIKSIELKTILTQKFEK